MKVLKKMLFLGVFASIVSTANARPPMVEIERPGDCKSVRCGGGGGGGVPRPTPVVVADSPEIALLKRLEGARCDKDVTFTATECMESKKDALKNKCITQEGFDWLFSKSLAITCYNSKPRLVCPCSCFDKGTKILTGANGNTQWTDADLITKKHVVPSFIRTSNVKNPEFIDSNINYTTSGPEKIDMYVLHLSTGKQLSLTQNHAVLLNTGELYFAKELIAGKHTLVGMDGENVHINQISRRPAKDGNVYNFLLTHQEESSHLVVAEGVIVGDTFFQTSWVNMIGTQFITK